jgi:hypothetical protein
MKITKKNISEERAEIESQQNRNPKKMLRSKPKNLEIFCYVVPIRAEPSQIRKQ